MLIVTVKGVPHIKNLKWNQKQANKNKQKKEPYFSSLLTTFSSSAKETSSFGLVG